VRCDKDVVFSRQGGHVEVIARGKLYALHDERLEHGYKAVKPLVSQFADWRRKVDFLRAPE
jgi:hypothetical protein